MAMSTNNKDLTKEDCELLIKMYSSEDIIIKYKPYTSNNILYHALKVQQVKYKVTLTTHNYQDFFSIINMYKDVLSKDSKNIVSEYS
jgi:hypothetical protein